MSMSIEQQVDTTPSTCAYTMLAPHFSRLLVVFPFVCITIMITFDLLHYLKVWPRGIPAAGSFWNYNDALRSDDLLYKSLIKHTHQVRLLFCKK